MRPRKGFLSVARELPKLAARLSLIALAVACQGPQTVLTQLDDARMLAGDLHVEFSKAADASNRAVMADTDEASSAFAKESQHATQLAGADVAALAPLLTALGYPRELSTFAAFKGDFSKYQELDRNILALAVENTNLKAQALSFGPAKQAADKFHDSLAPLAASVPAKDRCQVTELVAQAVTAVREIQVLHAPHIAEHEDAVMTKLEQEMASLFGTADGALKQLNERTPPDGRAALATARAALDDFKSIHAQLIVLSRRNTNVLSLDLSLRKAPALAAACDERLSALQAQLAKEGTQATR